jgi:hypothetical protein
LTGFAEKLKKEDHDNNDDRPENQVLIKGTQELFSGIEFLRKQINIVCLSFQYHGFAQRDVREPIKW